MWLPDKLYVNFAADGVRLCEANWNGVRAQALLPLAPPAASVSWQPWVQALAGWLAPCAERRFNLHVVLSDRFVRYQILPWRPGLGGKAEWQAYANHRFLEVFGELARGWQIRIAPTPPGEMALASAVDADLVAALRSLVVRPPRLVSLQPRFVAGYNLWRRKLKSRSCWFACLEPGRVCVALIEKGRWRVLRNEGGSGCSLLGLPALLHRFELAVAPAGPVPIYLCGDLQGQTPPEEIGGRPVYALQLPERWSAGKQHLALARGM